MLSFEFFTKYLQTFIKTDFVNTFLAKTLYYSSISKKYNILMLNFEPKVKT